MTDETADHETAPAAPPIDPFAAVLALIALAENPKALAARVKELRGVLNAAEKAKADLVAARAEHDAYVSIGIRKLEIEGAAILKRRVELRREESDRLTREALLAQQRARPRRPNRLVDVGGIVREFDDELDARAPFIAGDDSAVPNHQNNLPLLPKRSLPRTGRSRRLSAERFGASSLTRDAG